MRISKTKKNPIGVFASNKFKAQEESLANLQLSPKESLNPAVTKNATLLESGEAQNPINIQKVRSSFYNFAGANTSTISTS